MLTILAVIAAPAGARVSLGQFGHWGVFREGARCFALAEPVSERRGGAPLAAFASTPGRRPQFRATLSRKAASGGPASAAIGTRRFPLVADGADVRAANALADTRIVAAVRGGERLAIEAVDARGRRFRDVYPLAGAATAIDAAVIGCLPPPAQGRKIGR